MNTQLICESKPFCLCVGKVNEWDECDCHGSRKGARCVGCDAKLIRINTETGEGV